VRPPNPYLEIHRVLQDHPGLARELRKKLIWAYAWAVPSDEALAEIAAHGPVLEVGAGTGYWAWLLAQTGARVRAVDTEPQQSPRWLPLEAPDTERDQAFGAETLLLCWPPLDSPMAYEALRAYAARGGSRVAYVGEWRGRTGDAAFHDELETAWTREREIEIPRWPGFEDRLYIYRR
jgi:hypothetical protein